MRRYALLCLLALGPVSCGGGAPTAPASPDPATGPPVISVTPRGFPERIAAGGTAQLSLDVTFDDGAEQIVTEGALWTSSDAAIASIDDHGVLTARRNGRVNIVAALKGVSVSVPVGVVPNVSGAWAITAPPGDGRWTSLTFAQVTQQGAEISGRWQWDSGVALALAGTVDEQGDIALTGRECYGGYTYGWVLFEARDWTMAFEGARGVFVGDVTMSRSGRYIGGVCSGAIVHDQKPTVTDLPVSIEVLR